ncbi:hypothetical protein BCR44DRAFT_1505516 [Catenaria anguillulae PL171]|uniref:Tudor domain-containing protein n=1 Tax=Catenaria anguillulae PL171 TaxID=765915 RepID=A0A1Y2H4V9_9FUNG|nr:hypothetical protein BCR44DRAFT_1505516 [Catenaria anguillulae PL171]
MSAQEELEQYEYQLAQIEQALAQDSSNADLRKLRDDLVEVIDLTRSLLPAPAPEDPAPPSSRHHLHDDSTSHDDHDDYRQVDSHDPALDSEPHSAPPLLHPQWSVGDTIIARYSANNKLYECTVTAVSTRTATCNADIMYSVMFKGYASVELVKQADTFAYDPALLAPAKPKQPATAMPGAAGAGGHRKPAQSAWSATSKFQQPAALGPAMTVTTVKSSSSSSSGPGGKAPSSSASAKKDPAAKAAKRAAKLEQIEAMHKHQQQSWKQFAAGGKAKSSGTAKKSIFATPDNPLAKVGVTGSGRGMTENKDRGKHKFQPY